MTVIEPEQIECPECGTSYTVYVLLSTNNFGDDGDWIARDFAKCPDCGHEMPMDVIEFVEEAE